MEALNKALADERIKKVRVVRLAEVDMPKADVVYEVQIAGLG